jgi:biopolymer transport protein ExbB
MKTRQTNRFLILVGAVLAVLSGTTWAAASPPQAPVSLYAHFFVAGGPIVWFILLPMSVAVLYLAMDLCLSLRRKRLLPPDMPSLLAAHAAQYGTAGLAERFSRRSALVSRAVLRAFQRSQQLHSDAAAVRQFAAESLQEIGQHLLRKAEWCQIIGSVAPMVGLFGTVFGMIQAFNLLGIAEGRPAFDQLAGAISVALVTTFWGLMVAIPALVCYSIFRSRIEAYLGEAAVETDVLLGQLFKIQALAAARTAPKIANPPAPCTTPAEPADHIREVLYMTEPPHSG